MKSLDPFENKVAKSVRLQERFTHRELAQMVGTTRETVSRIINRLKQSGYIIPEDGYMILQTDKLKKSFVLTPVKKAERDSLSMLMDAKTLFSSKKDDFFTIDVILITSALLSLC